MDINPELFGRVSYGLYCLTRPCPTTELGIGDETFSQLAKRHSADSMKTFTL